MRGVAEAAVFSSCPWFVGDREPFAGELGSAEDDGAPEDPRSASSGIGQEALAVVARRPGAQSPATCSRCVTSSSDAVRRYSRRRSRAAPCRRRSRVGAPARPFSFRSWPQSRNSIACQPVLMFASPPRSFARTRRRRSILDTVPVVDDAGSGSPHGVDVGLVDRPGVDEGFDSCGFDRPVVEAEDLGLAVEAAPAIQAFRAASSVSGDGTSRNAPTRARSSRAPCSISEYIDRAMVAYCRTIDRSRSA